MSHPLLGPLRHLPPGDEARRDVEASESAPADETEAVPCQGWRTAIVTVDQHDTVTSGTVTVYFSDAADATPQPHEAVALHATQLTELRYRLGGKALIAARITALVGTRVRVSIHLTQEEAS